MDPFQEIEAKWQQAWEKKKAFEADPNPKQPKCFVTFPYSYANGPVHVGHGFTAARVDVYARFKRMQGYNVLFPWAWHWTGTSIAGASERVKLGDEQLIKALTEIDGVPKEELRKFIDPVYLASYYTNENKTVIRRTGFSIDWRREFHTASPAFSKFIEWQYQKLREKKYVIKGTHPVVWCSHCKSPTGDHDRQEGIGVAPEEYTLIKFSYKDTYLPAATFRPETIYGATNIWLNPEAQYVEIQVDGEHWIVSEKAAEKIKEQKKTVELIKKLSTDELIGKTVKNPINETTLLVLPASFVNPDHATGVVYSVPAHAPVDWLALRDLKQEPVALKKYSIEKNIVENIQPISLIKVEEFGDYPAIEIVDNLEVEDQCDPKAEEATKLLYKKEFHSGVLKKTCGPYSGKAVRDVKEMIIADFKKKRIAEVMYDLPQSVTCRCLTPCIVKVLEGQWFLKYSDPQWKSETREALLASKIRPESATSWFLNTIDWLKDWPCARKSGLGTPLPWNKDWIIETLSDSTIYMAFYTINKHIKQHNIRPDQLIPEVFDYIFYGKGDQKLVAQKSEIKPDHLRSMRDEFIYWYPVDMRNSAKELIPNHLTFFIFHHVALFPPEHWPQMIGANGMVMSEGQPMSKSKGIFAILRRAIQQYGADSTRAALLLGAEGMDDPDWRVDHARETKEKLESFLKLAESIIKASTETRDEDRQIDDWLTSTMQHRIREVTKNLENMETRTAFENTFFGIWNDIRWFIRRRKTRRAEALLKALRTWTKLLTPFIPHVCEEIWSGMGEEGFISLSSWPEPSNNLVNTLAEESEDLIRSVLQDTLNIIRATKVSPKKIYYYTAAQWKWEAFLETLSQSMKEEDLNQRDLIKKFLDHDKSKAKSISRFVLKIVDEVNKTIQHRKERILSIGILDEFAVLRNAKGFLRKELSAEVKIIPEEDKTRYDPKNRAELAKPYRPAIYIE